MSSDLNKYNYQYYEKLKLQAKDAYKFSAIRQLLLSEPKIPEKDEYKLSEKELRRRSRNKLSEKRIKAKRQHYMN